MMNTTLPDPDTAGCDAYIASLKSAKARVYAEALARYYLHGGAHPHFPWPSGQGVSVHLAPSIRANVAYYLTGQGDRWGRVPKRHGGR